MSNRDEINKKLKNHEIFRIQRIKTTDTYCYVNSNGYCYKCRRIHDWYIRGEYK